MLFGLPSYNLTVMVCLESAHSKTICPNALLLNQGSSSLKSKLSPHEGLTAMDLVSPEKVGRSWQRLFFPGQETGCRLPSKVDRFRPKRKSKLSQLQLIQSNEGLMYEFTPMRKVIFLRDQTFKFRYFLQYFLIHNLKIWKFSPCALVSYVVAFDVGLDLHRCK